MKQPDATGHRNRTYSTQLSLPERWARRPLGNRLIRSTTFQRCAALGRGHDGRMKTIGPVRVETPFTVVVERPQGSVAKSGR